MSDDDKTNIGKFYNTSKKPEVEDTRTVAEKDSTNMEHKPPHITRMGASHNSPTGTVPIKQSRDVRITVTTEELPDRDMSVLMDRSDINIDYENKGFTVLVRRDSEKSAKGIEGGHISRLTLAKGDIGDEKIFAHYDDGRWIKKPSTFLATQVVMEAKTQDNGITVPSIKPAFDRAHDPDIDI